MLGCGIQSDEESSVDSLRKSTCTVSAHVSVSMQSYKNTMPSNEQIRSKGNLKNVLFESLTLDIFV